MELLRNGSEIDFMEEMLRVLSVKAQAISSAAEALTTEDLSSVTDEKTEVMRWLEGFSNLEKFSLLKQFANKQLLQRLHDFLTTVSSVAPEVIEAYSS